MLRGRPRLDRSFRLPDDDPDVPEAREIGLGADCGTDVGDPEPGDRRPGGRIGGQGEGAPGQPAGPHVRNGLLAEDAMNRPFHPHQDANLGGERAGRSRSPENRTDSPGIEGLIWCRRLPHGG